jgi:transcriptional regulator with XRE-family HTH domain
MVKNYADCINNIQKVAKSQGKTMKYLCDLLNKRRGFLSEVRNGKDKLDEGELQIIADELNTTPEHLCEPSDTFVVKRIIYDASQTNDAIAAGFEMEADKHGSNFMVNILSDPQKMAIFERLAELDVETLLKVEQIIDMIKK